MLNPQEDLVTILKKIKENKIKSSENKTSEKREYVFPSNKLVSAFLQYKNSYRPVAEICEANQVSKHELYNHIRKKQEQGFDVQLRSERNPSLSYEDKLKIAIEMHEDIAKATTDYSANKIRNVKDFVRGKNKLISKLEELTFEDASMRSFYLSKDSNLSQKMAENIILEHYITKVKAEAETKVKAEVEKRNNIYPIFQSVIGQ